MYYEINVSLNGRHLFATAERSITTIHELKKAYWIMIRKFPVNEGFQVSVTQWDKRGVTIIKEIIEELIRS